MFNPDWKKQVENGGQPQVLMTSVDEVLEEDVDVWIKLTVIYVVKQLNI